MQIVLAQSSTRYVLVGDLHGPERDGLTAEEFDICNSPSGPNWGLRASSREDAVREILVFELAMSALRSDEAIAPEIDCRLLRNECNGAEEAFANLSAKDIISLPPECSALSTDDTCHSFHLQDDRYTWLLEFAMDESNRISAFHIRVFRPAVA
jgi:hypothetical protein